MKKLLALVLALVMTLGLATVGANAADFKDESSIEYEEAVNVMSGIGVIQGDDNGNFNPKDGLTREQAAKIVAYMLLGQTGADSLSASAAPFADVAQDRWSAGAISYCATEGIIAGLGDGTFNPAGKLTGHQFAKMLLVALGYNATYENLVNDKDWAINVAKLAVAAGLEDDLAIVMSQDMTREQAAKMAFNTLTADMVEYENPVNVKTGDGTEVNVGAKRSKSNDWVAADRRYDGRVAGDDTTDKFCEIYFPDLKLVQNAFNDFGEPVNQWTFKSVVVSEEAKSADKVLVGGVTYEDLYAAAGTAAMNSVNDLSIYVDGQMIGQASAIVGFTAGDKSTTLPTETAGKFWAKDNDDDLSWDPFGAGPTASSLGLPTGNGTITTVYVDSVAVAGGSDRYDIIIAVKHVYAGKINSVTEASGSDARKVSVTAKTQPGQTLTGVTLDTDYETKEFKKDDIVTFTVAVSAGEASIQSMELATLVSGVEVTKTSSEATGTTYKPNKSVVTAGGKDYKLNINVKAEDITGSNAITAFDAGDKFDLYLDSNGLIVFAEKTEEELDLNRYLVLTRGAMASGTASNPVADAITLAGNKLSNINITKYDGTSLSNWSQIELYKIYKYTLKGTDYELDPVGSAYGSNRIANLTYTSGKATFTGMPGTLTSSSTLYAYDLTDSGVKTYNGVSNFPDIKAGFGSPATGGTTDGGEYLLTVEPANTAAFTAINGTYVNKLGITNNATATVANTTLNATYTNAVVSLTKNGNVLAAVVVHNSDVLTGAGTNTVYSNISASTSASDIIYVTSKNFTTSKSGDDTVYTFDVIKEGKVTTVSTTKTGVRDALKADQDLYLIDAYDGEYVDKVTARSAANPTLALATASGTTSWGRDTISKDTDTTTTTIECGTSSGVYSVSADVVGGTFKVEDNDENGNGTTYVAFATNSSTKFFEIASNGKVTEVDASNFNYDSIVEGEFSVIYDGDNEIASYIFFQKV